MPTCLLGLGSNLGDSARMLSEAVARLNGNPHIEVLRQSGARKTSPVGGPAGQAEYLNAAAVVRTSLSPHELLAACQETENSLGRLREARWGPRTIDIDLLLYDDLVLNEPDLRIPHPRMAWRRFVIEPAAEIADEMVHPTIRWTVGHLLYHLNSTPWYLAITGLLKINAEVMAAQLARKVRARLLDDRSHLGTFPDLLSTRDLQIALKFLRRRVRLLDRERMIWHSSRPAVSSFWFDESAVSASFLQPTGECAEFLARFKESTSRVVRPRLVVMLHVSLEAFGGDDARRKRRVEALEKCATAAGPVLRLDSLHWEKALFELTAAVQAMR